MRRIVTAARFALMAFAVSGCGATDGGGTSRVSGTVTFKGKPVALGRVYFDADQQKNPGGQSGFADLVNGTYDTAKGGKTPSAGAVRVRVEGLTPPGADGLHGLLFRQYEFPAELAAGPNAKDIDVPAAQGDKMPKNAGPGP